MTKILVTILLSLSYYGYSQNVGINTTGIAPLASAMLDVSSTNKGLLVPRVDIVDLATALPVTAPTTSLLVYNTNVISGVGYYFWDGTKWTKVSDANSNSDHDWYEVGGTLSPDNINDHIFTQGKVGIGVTTIPTENLKVGGNIEVDSYQLGSGNGVFFRNGFNSITSPYNLSITTDTYDGGTTPDALSINGFEGVSISTGHNTIIQRRLTIINNGNVGINTITPTEKLEIQGAIKIVDGTEGAGKGLFSDATGKASWQNTVSNPTFISAVFNTGQTVFSFNTNLTISAVWGSLRSQ